MCAPYGLTWKSLKQTRGAKLCADLTFLRVFFFAVEPCFDRSRVKNFQNTWGGGGIHSLSVGRAGTETLHAKEAANKEEKKRFPPTDGCISIRTVRARYNIFHLRRIRTQELVWVKTCMTIHFDPFGFYIRFFLFFFPLVSLFIGCGMHCASARSFARSLAPQC